MPLVHVKYFGFNAEGVEGVYSADTENDLLTHAHLKIAAVKLCRNQTIFRSVFGNIGVEQVEIHASYTQLPDFRVNLTIQNADGDQDSAVIPSHITNWQVMEILVKTDSVLNAFFVDFLAEIA